MPAATPKWELDAREQIKTSIRRFQKPIRDLAKANANESNTRLLITDFICEALGYSKFEDIATEQAIRGEFADYAIRIDNQPVAIVEAKAITQQLKVSHLRQAESYAMKDGLDWAVLTNGQIWQVYRVIYNRGQQLTTSLVFEVDLLGEEPVSKKVDKLIYLHRASLKRETINELWRQRSATSPEALAGLLMTDTVLDAIRKAIRRQSNLNPELTTIKAAIRTTVIKQELLSE